MNVGGYKFGQTAALPEPMEKGQKLNWNFKIQLIGEKVVDPRIHCCELCDSPILVYGRMISCKHVFCHDCATKEPQQSPTDGSKKKRCPKCHDEVSKVEKCNLGQIHMCTFGASRHDPAGCRRTYLSERDLRAHMEHRHKETAVVATTTCATPTTPIQSITNVQPSPISMASMGRNFPLPSMIGVQTSLRPPPANRTSNLITIQLQGNDTPSAGGVGSTQRISPMQTAAQGGRGTRGGRPPLIAREPPQPRYY